MKLQEVAQQVQMTKRAIKYYEEKGLLQVEKDENGYRRYTEEHIAVLSAISADSHHDAGAAGCLSGNSHILGYNRPEDAAVYENRYISDGVFAKSAGRSNTGKAGCTAEKATGTECKAVRANEKGGSPSVSGSEILSASLSAFLYQ